MTRRTFILVAIFAAAGLITVILLVLLSPVIDRQIGGGRFIGSADAIAIVKETYPYMYDLEPQFGYLRYENASKGNVIGRNDISEQYSWYSADRSTTQVGELFHSNITLTSMASEKKKDAYVWAMQTGDPPPAGSVLFVDAETGELIGTWLRCPSCLCYHAGMDFKPR